MDSHTQSLLEQIDRAQIAITQLEKEVAELKKTFAIEEAIWIIVTAMNEVKAAKSGDYWYLEYMKLKRIWLYLCEQKYFGEER